MSTRARNVRSSRAQKRVEMLLRISEAMEDAYDEPMPQIDELVAAAGIARSTFYVHFEDKYELLAALADVIFREFTVAAEFWWSLPRQAAKADVHEAMERMADAYRSRRGTVAALIDGTANDTQMREAYRAIIAVVIGRMAEAIDGPGTDGERPADGPRLDAEATATWLSWLLERGMQQLVMPADADETERLMSALTDLVWNVLYAPDSPADDD